MTAAVFFVPFAALAFAIRSFTSCEVTAVSVSFPAIGAVDRSNLTALFCALIYSPFRLSNSVLCPYLLLLLSGTHRLVRQTLCSMRARHRKSLIPGRLGHLV